MTTKPRGALAAILLAALLLPSCLSTARAQEEQTPAAAGAAQERDHGIGLYQRGDIKAAIKVLRAAVKLDKNDGEAWHFLGLALHRDGEVKEARKAVERAVKLRPDFVPSRSGLAYLLLLSNKQREALREAEAALALDPKNSEAHYIASVVRLRQDAPARALEEIQAALAATPDFAAALLWKSEVLLALYVQKTGHVEGESPQARAERNGRALDLLKQAAESLERYLQLNPSLSREDVWREQLETLRVFARSPKEGGSDNSTVLTMGEVTTKARVLTRAEPQYTEEARKNRVGGTVVLRAVFAADGTVKNILVLRSLPHGLTEAAVQAARGITFVPATKDGRPVSQFIQIEYNFHIN
jgi:TonB family protein